MMKSHSHKLSEEIRRCSILKYGYALNATKLADEYNLRSHKTTVICRETARKWLRGISFPDPIKLQILINWLGISVEAIYPLKNPKNQLVKNSNPLDNAISTSVHHLTESSKKIVLSLSTQLEASESNRELGSNI
jgi:hypothetical protein